MTSDRQQLRRRGFTLIELIVVIGVVVILIGLLFGGFAKWQDTAKRNLTITRLEMLNSMLAELEAQGHATFQNQWFMSSNPANALDARYFGNVRADAVPVPPQYDEQGNLNVPNDVIWYQLAGILTQKAVAFNNRYEAILYMSKGMSIPAISGINSNGWSCPVGIMQQLTTLPNNATALAGITTDGTALDVMFDAAHTGGLPPFSATGPAVILDGWGNPILFAPAAGLCGVYANTATKNASPQPLTPGQANIVISPDGRPFFVSAGPDGDFITGDDNIYSFNLH
jgi:prepilin-type N-terminal cleavage/methylation domain-containing protein